MSRLDKRRKGVFGPPMGKKCIIFVDDLNMPALETFGAQPPIELLRQFIDHKNWYNPLSFRGCVLIQTESAVCWAKELSFALFTNFVFTCSGRYDLKTTAKISLIDIQILTAMGPPGGGRNAVTSRFLRHFNIFSINVFSDDTMVGIFSSIMLFCLKINEFPTQYFTAGQEIVSATLEVSCINNLMQDKGEGIASFLFRRLICLFFFYLLLLKVYKQAMKNLLPTPAKSHYTFNLRDFSRVIQGCLMLKKQSLENKHTMIRLFVHEVFRVFYDRLVDDKDREWLFDLMHTIVKNTFDESFEKVFEHLKQGSKVSRDIKSRRQTCTLKTDNN